uniref:G-protein coupled receptors family 1 profile domain-containing protein n=1 Tax=Ditylenchus dipsaci TaxID=166011 RepID=A0A915DIY5_9BILA
MLHQSAVFWIPFLSLLASYLLIIMKAIQTHSREPTLLELSTDTVVLNELSVGSTVSGDMSPEKKSSTFSATFNNFGYFLRGVSLSFSSRRSSTAMRRRDTIRSYCLSTEAGYPQMSKSVCYSNKSNSPIWKRQLRSKVFITSLAIVLTHCAFWLPYNLLNSVRLLMKIFTLRW